jgi:hypothetical protein
MTRDRPTGPRAARAKIALYVRVVTGIGAATPVAGDEATVTASLNGLRFSVRALMRDETIYSLSVPPWLSAALLLGPPIAGLVLLTRRRQGRGSGVAGVRRAAAATSDPALTAGPATFERPGRVREPESRPSDAPSPRVR